MPSLPITYGQKGSPPSIDKWSWFHRTTVLGVVELHFLLLRNLLSTFKPNFPFLREKKMTEVNLMNSLLPKGQILCDK